MAANFKIWEIFMNCFNDIMLVYVILIIILDSGMKKIAFHKSS